MCHPALGHQRLAASSDTVSKHTAQARAVSLVVCQKLPERNPSYQLWNQASPKMLLRSTFFSLVFENWTARVKKMAFCGYCEKRGTHQVHHTHGLTCHYYSLPALSLPCRWKHSGNPGPDNGGQIRTLEHHQVILFGLANTSQVPTPLSARPWAEHSIFEKTQTFPQRI